MAKKKEVEVQPEIQIQPDLCGAWAFILGPSMGAFCRMVPGHEGDHRTEIKVYAEPQSRFTVTWALGPQEL